MVFSFAFRSLTSFSICAALSRITCATCCHCGSCAAVIFRRLCRLAMRASTPLSRLLVLVGAAFVAGAVLGAAGVALGAAGAAVGDVGGGALGVVWASAGTTNKAPVSATTAAKVPCRLDNSII